jgi:hypothetical protein
MPRFWKNDGLVASIPRAVHGVADAEGYESGRATRFCRRYAE